MDAGNRAFVVHRTPHRIRIKIPRWERQDARFTMLQRALEGRPGVVSVHVNPLVASVVIHCGNGFEIASVRDCFEGLELVLPAPPSASARTWQIVSARRTRDHSKRSISLVGPLIGLVIKLALAVATRRLDALIRELIFEVAAQVLVRQLYRQRIQVSRLKAPPALLVAAVG
jgi:hypothetical protein